MPFSLATSRSTLISSRLISDCFTRSLWFWLRFALVEPQKAALEIIERVVAEMGSHLTRELKYAFDEVCFMWRPLRASVDVHLTRPDVVLKSLESLEIDFDSRISLLSKEVVNNCEKLLSSLAPDGSFALTASDSKIVLFYYPIDCHCSNATLRPSGNKNSIPSHLLPHSSVLKLPASKT